MLHDCDFAAITGERCAREIRVQLRSGSGHFGRYERHLSRLPSTRLDDCGAESPQLRSDSFVPAADQQG
jgi:hypothetical protein